MSLTLWNSILTREDSEPGQHTDRSEDFVNAERIDEDHGSEVSGEEEVFEVEELVEVEEFRAMPPGVRAALRLVDDWDLIEIFRRRVNVIKSVRHCLKGPFRNAMKVLLDEIVEGWECNDGFDRRAWKAFCFCQGCCCTDGGEGGKIGKDKLKERFDSFRAGRWADLLAVSIAHDEEACTMATRKRRTQNHGDLEHRVNRAMTRIQLGELTAGRQALEGADLAPGTQETLHQLRQRPARTARSSRRTLCSMSLTGAFYLGQFRLRPSSFST